MSPAKRDSAKRKDGGEPGDRLVPFDEVSKLVSDPAVAALLEQRERAQREARMPRRAREKKIRERERMAARREGHTCYDIPPELRGWVKSLSEELGIPASQIATLALLRFAKEWQAGSVDLRPYKTPSKSPRYEWNLALKVEEFGVKKGRA